jgi:hypothetical protein
MGAPGAVLRPMTDTVPPGWTLAGFTVSEMGATHAHAMPAEAMTAINAVVPSAQRQRVRRDEPLSLLKNLLRSPSSSAVPTVGVGNLPGF